MKTKIIISTVLVAPAAGCIVRGRRNVPRPANISKVEFAPSAVTTADDVTVVATVTDLQGVTSVKLHNKVNGGSQTE